MFAFNGVLGEYALARTAEAVPAQTKVLPSQRYHVVCTERNLQQMEAQGYVADVEGTGIRMSSVKSWAYIAYPP